MTSIDGKRDDDSETFSTTGLSRFTVVAADKPLLPEE